MNADDSVSPSANCRWPRLAMYPIAIQLTPDTASDAVTPETALQGESREVVQAVAQTTRIKRRSGIHSVFSGNPLPLTWGAKSLGAVADREVFAFKNFGPEIEKRVSYGGVFGVRRVDRTGV